MKKPAPKKPWLLPRQKALWLLKGVLERGKPLFQLEERIKDSLAPGERAEASRLAATTLRNWSRAGHVTCAHVKKPPPAQVDRILRLAACELFVHEAAAHGVVSSAVEIARMNPKTRHMAGFVNAVLRKVSSGGRGAWLEAGNMNLPDWMSQALEREYGGGARERICEAHGKAPPLDITARDPGRAADLARRLGAKTLPNGSLRLWPKSAIQDMPGFAEGEWWVQDAAASIPARLAGDLKGKAALDLCAAPGGKTLQMAAAGARVTALDISESRLGRLRENLGRTGLEAEVIHADALLWDSSRSFDLVVLDAPCTSTGTIRRHPDVPFLRSEKDLESLAGLQERLLDRAAGWVGKSGLLLYCVCSLLPEEGEGQIRKFLGARRDFKPETGAQEGLGLEPGWRTELGRLLLRPDFWPDLGGMDGFYMALLRRGNSPREGGGG